MLQRQQILDEALRLAGKTSWESFSLLELSQNLDLSLDDIRQFYRCKDDLAEELFNRADQAMLAQAKDSSFLALSEQERLVECIMSWYLALAPYKKLVREILAYKLEPGHFHLQAHGITRVSRTVQWFLVAADRRYSGIRRSADEIALTSAYLTSLSFFLFDQSKAHQSTRSLLAGLISKIEQAHALLKGRAHPVKQGNKSQ